MQVVRASPHVGEDQGPEVHDRQAIRIHGASRLLGDEVVHHAQEACGQEEANGVVAIPPLHHGVLDTSVGRVALHEVSRDRSAVHHVQQCHRQDEGTKEPVGHIDVLDLAHTDGAKEHDGIGHPDQRDQDVNRPFEFSVFLALGVAQWQADDSPGDDQHPTPEGEGRQGPGEQANLTGALHHVVTGGEQCATTKPKDHRIGVQGSQAAVTEPRNAKVEFRPGKLGGDDDAHQHANHPHNHGQDRKLPHHRIVVVRSICFWRIHRAPLL
ncbi:hypothetical protein D3C71_1356240 [compost metagenome]